MMKSGPIQTNPLPSSPLMLGGYHRPMARQQAVGIPACFKHCFMRCPPTRLLACPHLAIINSLERFIRTQNQARDIATHVLKAFCSPE